MRCSTITSRASSPRSTWRRAPRRRSASRPMFANVDACARRAVHVLVMKIKKPFSHTVPMNGFPQDVEIWTRSRGGRKEDRGSAVARRHRAHGRRDGTAQLPLARRSAGDDSLGGSARRRRSQEHGRRSATRWSRSRHRSPGQPTEVAKTEWRYGGINYTDAGIALLSENDRATRRTRSWILEPGAAPRKVWERKQDAAYDDPGHRRSRRRDSGATASAAGAGEAAPAARSSRTATSSTSTGVGASKDGDRPFLDTAERPHAEDRADLPLLGRIARIVRRAAQRPDDEVPDALRDAEGRAELLHAQTPAPTRSSAVTTVQGPAAGRARHPPAVRHLHAQRRGHALRHAVSPARLQAGDAECR